MFKIKPIVLVSSLITAITSSYLFAAESDKNKLPEIGTAGVSVLSVDKERRIGQAMMRHIRASQPVISDPVLSEYINRLGNIMVRNANDVNYSFEFFLINSRELNAFAFFGGHVGVHSGLLTTAESESELASVIAHEISHVTQRHLARRLESQSRSQPLTMAAMISGLLISLVNPSLGIAALTTSMAASQQAGINYTRGNEKEADRVGITLLANSGFDPMGAPDFFGKMAAKYRYKSTPPAMLLTHPMPESRIAEARIRAQNMPPIRLAPSLSFELAKARIIARYERDPEVNIQLFLETLEKQRYAIKEAANYGLGISYFEHGEYNKAKLILQALLANDPNNLFYIDVLSDIYIKTKEFNQATLLLADLNLLMPNNQVVALNYANVLQEAEKYDQSALILQDFLLVNPGHFIANDLLATVYRKQKKTALMHVTNAEVYALLGAYPRAIDELQTGYNFAD
ncbi:MAG: putative Zn-dependent protease, partial [Alteromonadaceae bacterium]